MTEVPHIILLGYGVLDSLQLTVETQQVLTRYGRACTLGLPPNLARHLRSLHVKVTDLSVHLAPGRPFADAYLCVGRAILERTARERPVVVLVPGNPLATNATARFLALEGQRLGLTVQALPGVSQLDVILSGIGLDVSTFGLQVFDAWRLVARRQRPNPEAPLLLLHAGGFGLEELPVAGDTVDLAPLASYLCGFYLPDHPVALLDVTLAPAALTVAVVPLRGLPAAANRVTAGSSLFLDAVAPDPALSENAV